jgi:hypothetical protein
MRHVFVLKWGAFSFHSELYVLHDDNAQAKWMDLTSLKIKKTKMKYKKDLQALYIISAIIGL